MVTLIGVIIVLLGIALLGLIAYEAVKYRKTWDDVSARTFFAVLVVIAGLYVALK